MNMITRKKAMHVVVLLSVAVTSAASGQEAEFFRYQLESQISEVDNSASALMDELLQKPKEARDAAMVVSQYPELIVRLRYADAQSPSSVAAIASEYPADVSQAAVTLSRHADTLQLLSGRLVGAGLLGRVYAQNKGTALVAMDRMSQQAIEMAAATSSAWRSRLSRTAAAGGQMAAARQAYTSQVGTDGVIVMAPALSGGPDDLPPAPLVAYILKNADQYSDLASEIVDQWENERNPEEFRRAVDFWYANGRDILPWDFSDSAGDRAKILKEYAQFEKALAALGVEPGVGIDRLGYLLDNNAAYPSLTDVRYAKQSAIANSQRTVISGAPFTSGGGGSSRSSSSSRSSGRSSGTRTRTPSSRTSRSATNSETGGRGGRNNNSNSDSGQGGFGGSSGGGFGNGSGGFGSGSSGFGSGSSGFGSGSGGFGSGSSGFGSGTSNSNRNNQSNSNNSNNR